jgi:hypothetical protein|tara:strand:+ start:60 stop:659 length:600 start_codon:yes stop_codon:yes gene_type:complete
MKPRFEKMSYETTVMLEKAKAMNDRLDRIEKEMTLPLSAGTPRTSKRGKMESMRTPREGMRETGEMPLPGTGDDTGMATKAEGCPDCGGKKCTCKDCPSCGSKVNKAGMCKANCVPGNKMAKAQPGFAPEKITDINPHFVAESGGQTKSGYFTTNGKTIETEDAKPKRKKADSKVNMERLSSRQNPHSDTGVVREEKFD